MLLKEGGQGDRGVGRRNNDPAAEIFRQDCIAAKRIDHLKPLPFGRSADPAMFDADVTAGRRTGL